MSKLTYSKEVEIGPITYLNSIIKNKIGNIGSSADI